MGRKNKQQPKRNWMVGFLLFAMVAFIASQIPWNSFSSNKNNRTNSQTSTQGNSESKSTNLNKVFNPTTSVNIIKQSNNDSIEVDVELALNDQDIQRGLMYRKSMPDHGGMLFVMPINQPQNFWMKNTYIPLDIIFISTDKKIVSIGKNTIPLSEKQVPSDGPAKYVLEVNAGFADAYELKKGDYIDFNLK